MNQLIERIIDFSRHQIMDCMAASNPTFRALYKPAGNVTNDGTCYTIFWTLKNTQCYMHLWSSASTIFGFSWFCTHISLSWIYTSMFLGTRGIYRTLSFSSKQDCLILAKIYYPCLRVFTNLWLHGDHLVVIELFLLRKIFFTY